MYIHRLHLLKARPHTSRRVRARMRRSHMQDLVREREGGRERERERKGEGGRERDGGRREGGRESARETARKRKKAREQERERGEREREPPYTHTEYFMLTQRSFQTYRKASTTYKCTHHHQSQLSTQMHTKHTNTRIITQIAPLQRYLLLLRLRLYHHHCPRRRHPVCLGTGRGRCQRYLPRLRAPERRGCLFQILESQCPGVFTLYFHYQ
jgi:hypothetical protein